MPTCRVPEPGIQGEVRDLVRIPVLKASGQGRATCVVTPAAPPYNVVMFSRLSHKLSEIFSIDVRSLALVRIFLSIIILQDIARRAFDIFVFYGDGGVLPAAFTQLFWTGDWAWSLHLLDGGSPQLLTALFIVEVFVALALLVGFYTRTATILMWVLIVSLHNANPLILQGEDVLLRVTLFVSMFLPLGAAFSVDSMRARKPAQKTVLSGWSVAYLLQLAFMYFFVSLYKQSEAWESGSAIYYALSIDQYATHLGRWLLVALPSEVFSFVTIGILVFQAMALFLLFSPYRTALIRTVTMVLLMLMHLGFAVSMHLGMFSAVAIAALCAFIPSQVWDGASAWMRKMGGVFARVAKGLSASVRADVPSRPSFVGAFVSIAGILYVFYIFFWHAGNVVAGPQQYVPFSHGFELPAKILRLDQRWNLFAPYPYRHDGWIVIAATQKDGTQVDLFRNGAPLSFERPDVIYDIYPRPRWRRYFLSLWPDGGTSFRVPYAEYLCRTWNEGRSGDDVIEYIDVTYMLEWTPPPGEPQAPVRPISLIAREC